MCLFDHGLFFTPAVREPKINCPKLAAVRSKKIGTFISHSLGCMYAEMGEK